MPPYDSLASRPFSPPGLLGKRLAALALMLALCGYVDMATGYEVSVFLIYMAPVALATRWFGAARGVLVACVAIAVWIWADRTSGHTYSHTWYLYVNASNRLACFLLAVGLIRHLKAQHHELRRRLQALTGSVAFCTNCERVGAGDGYWRPFEQHLVELGNAHPQHKVCPDCARRRYARPGYREPSQQHS